MLITGQLVKGRKIGRQIGFPTINLLIQTPYKPSDIGVYLVRTMVNKKDFFGMANLGSAPTLNRTERLLELNLFEFSEKHIDQYIFMIELLTKIRQIEKFDSITELVKQLRKDQKTCLQLIKEKFSS